MATDASSESSVLSVESPRLVERLRQVVRDKRRFLAARALLLAGLACLLLAAAIICIDVALAFGPAGRWTAFTLVLLSLALLLASRLVLPCRRYREHEAVRDLESACTGVGQLMRTSAEVAHEGNAKAFSPALSRALVRQAEETLAVAPMARVVPWPTLRRWGLGLGVVALLFAAAVVLWPDFRRGAVRLALPAAQVTFTRLDLDVTPESFERGQTVRLAARLSGRPPDRVDLAMRLPTGGWTAVPLSQDLGGAWSAEFAGLSQSFDIRLRAGDARARRHIRFLDPPLVLAATVEIEYPAYMRLPPATSPLQELRFPEGAIARFSFTLNHPLVRAAVVLPAGQRQDLAHEEATLSWEWTVTPGLHAFSLAGEDAEGLPLKPFGWQVHGLPDRRPEVTLEVPDEDISLTPIGETAVEASIKDDFGIAAVELILTIDGTEQRLDSRDFAEAPRQARVGCDLRLEDLGLAPGTPVRLHARARDFRPDRPGWSVSDIRVITIRPLKILREPAEPKPEESAGDTEQLQQDIATLEQAIERQKTALQETLERREEQPDSQEPMPETAAAEREIAEVVKELAERAEAPAEAQPNSPQQAQAEPAPLLAQAEEQLQHAAEALVKPELSEALRHEDQALAAMMQARDAMQQQLDEERAAQQQAAQPAQAQAQPPPPEAIEDLAERAEALARTERELRNQVAPDAQTQASQAQAEAQQQAQAEQQQAQAEPQPAQAEPQQAQAEPQPAQAEPQQAEGQEQQPAAAMSEAVAEASQQQEEAVQEAQDLAADVRQHPRTTALAARRMTTAAETMEEALTDLREQDPQAAAESLQEAQEQLEELATHLRGLDPVRAAETLDRAARMAEEAAQQLRGEEPPPETAQAQQPEPQPQPAQPETAQTPPAADPQQPQAQDPEATAPTPETSAEVARNAETIDDWLKRLATEPAKGLETTRNQLRELRAEQRTEALANQVAQAAQDRQEGRPEQARQAEQEAAQRFQQMAASLEQEHQRLVRSHLEQLAAAENEAKTLQSELSRQAQQSEPAPPETSERLRELANQLQDLRDAPLDKTARELREQLPPGAPPQGTQVPERVREEILPASLTRLRTLIDAVVQRELLVDRDSRIPEQYSGLVESYFRALSDDQK